MKQLPELDLEILEMIEAHTEPSRFVDFSSIRDYSADQIGYQVGLLAEKGLVEAVDTRSNDEPYGWSAVRLTSRGHEHLNAIRKPGSAEMAPARFERWKRRALQNPIIAALMLVFFVVVGFAAGWFQVTGEHLWVSLREMIAAGPESYDQCIDEANDVFTEIMKCKELFGERP